MSGRSKTELSWFYNRLSENNCKLTKPRQVILDVLHKRPKHLSADEIYMAVYKVFPSVGLATIYRNLELLLRIDLILKFDIGDNKARYELTQNSEEIHHHHLICKNCNRVIDYSQSIDDEREFVKRRERNLSKRYGFKIDGHFIDFFGLCKKCNNKL